MKKLFFIAAIFASAMLTFSACETGLTDDGGADTETPNNPNNPNDPEDPNDPNNPEDPNDPNNPEDPNNPNTPGEDEITDSELTPGEHKSRLEKIAIEFVEAFNPSDVEELVYSAKDLAEYAEYFDYGFETEEDIVDGPTPAALVRGLQRFSAADLVEFATRVAEDFVIDANDPDMNPYAGKCYTWNGDDYVWEETDGKDKTIVFEWDDTEAQISWFGSTKVEYLYDEEMNYIVYVPHDINISIKIDGKTHFTAKLETNITDIKTWAPKVTITLNGGYEIVAKSAGNSKGLEAGATIKKNDKVLLNAASVVAINDATDIDNWLEEYYCENCGENHMEVSDYFLEQVKTGSAQIDILALSIVASGDFMGMYKEIEEIDDRYDAWDDENYTYLPEEDRKECNAICECVNERVEVVLIYNDTKERVANIVLTTTSYYDEYDQCNRYNVEPILVFPDGSKFAFEEYFTEKAFGNLIDAVMELAEQVDSMVY